MPDSEKESIKSILGLTVLVAILVAFIGLFINPMMSLAASAYVYIMEKLLGDD